MLSLNAEAVGLIQNDQPELGLERLHEAKATLDFEGKQLAADGLGPVEPSLQRELQFVTYCNLGMLCSRADRSLSFDKAHDPTELPRTPHEHERWRLAEQWLQRALACAVRPTDCSSCVALASAQAEYALALQRLAEPAASVQERAEEAARLAVAAVALARRSPLQQPLSRRLAAELQQIAGTLGRAGRFEQARRLIEAAALAQDNGGRPRQPPTASTGGRDYRCGLAVRSSLSLPACLLMLCWMLWWVPGDNTTASDGPRNSRHQTAVAAMRVGFTIG